MAGGRPKKQKRGGGRPRKNPLESVPVADLAGGSGAAPDLTSPAAADQNAMENHGDAAGNTTRPLKRGGGSVYRKSTGSQHGDRLAQQKASMARLREQRRAEFHLAALRKVLEDMPDVDTPLGRGYLMEIEGEGAAVRAIVARGARRQHAPKCVARRPRQGGVSKKPWRAK